MLKRCFIVMMAAVCGLEVASADTIQLKDKAAVVGKILAEKHDQVVVDIGYTVLMIPRGQITKISRQDDAAPTVKAVAPDSKEPVVSGPVFYSSALKPAAARNVRDLVSLLGES